MRRRGCRRLALCGSRVDCRNPAHILFAFRAPRIVSRLHAHPNPSAVSEQLAEPNRNSRRDRLSLAQNIIEMLPRNTEKPRDLGLSLAGRRYHVLPQQGAGVGWQRSGFRLATGAMTFSPRAGAIAPSEFIGHDLEGVRAAGVDIGEAALERGVKQCKTLLAFLDQTHAFK
jgi:hypothetical protein